MQAIKETVQCPRCGCIALPDATKCPKCGTTYNGNRAKDIIDTISYLSNSKIEDAGVQVVRAYYQLTCPYHGKVNVRASVVAPTIKCPFCPQR